MSEPSQPNPSMVSVALGSNLGDRASTLALAIDALARIPLTSLVAASISIETAPVGPVEQPAFLNAAALLRTLLTPHSLLAFLHEIERAAGRKRSAETRCGPRTLDLDIITFGDQTSATPALTIPHPRAHERLFVLEPLASIAPQLLIPGRGTVGQLLAALRIQPTH